MARFCPKRAEYVPYLVCQDCETDRCDCNTDAVFALVLRDFRQEVLSPLFEDILCCIPKGFDVVILHMGSDPTIRQFARKHRFSYRNVSELEARTICKKYKNKRWY